MRTPYRIQWMVVVVTSIVVTATLVAPGENLHRLLPERRSVVAAHTSSGLGAPALHAILDTGRNTDLRWPDFTLYKTEVAKLYESNGNSLLWIQNGRVRPQGLAIIELLRNANGKGLDPEDYDGSAGRAAFRCSIKSLPSKT